MDLRALVWHVAAVPTRLTTMNGIVRNIQKDQRRGFIRIDGRNQDIPFYFDDIEGGDEDIDRGDRVECEEGQGRNNRPKATNIRITNRNNRQSGGGNQGAEIGATWHFGDAYVSPTEIAVPLHIAVTSTTKKGGKDKDQTPQSRPVVSATVMVWANGVLLTNASGSDTTDTDGGGMVFHELILHPAATSVSITAKVTVRGQTKAYTTRWEKKHEHAHLAIVEGEGLKWKTFTLTVSDGKEANAKTLTRIIQFISTMGCTLAVRIAGATVWLQGTTVELECKGKMIAQVQLVSPSSDIPYDEIVVGIKDEKEQEGPFFVPSYMCQ